MGSSIFQALVDGFGIVQMTTAVPASPGYFRGLAFRTSDGRIHGNTIDPVAGWINGIPVSAAGVVCLTVAAPLAPILGGLYTAADGRLCHYTPGAPDVYHQGVGIRSNGQLACNLIA